MHSTAALVAVIEHGSWYYFAELVRELLQVLRRVVAAKSRAHILRRKDAAN